MALGAVGAMSEMALRRAANASLIALGLRYSEALRMTSTLARYCSNARRPALVSL